MIKDILNVEVPVNEIFMVKQATRATSTNGSPYLSLVLQDVTGTIDAKMWQIEEADIEIATPGSLVRVIGNSGIYRGHPQLKINELEAIDSSNVDMSKYIPVAPIKREVMIQRLKELISEIQDEELKALTVAVLKDNYKEYISYPAAVTVHHAYLGGLLYHSLSICEMAVETQKHYTYLNKDYLISGSLLHDIGKTKEFSGPVATTYTTEGNLIGHIVLGAMIVHQKGLELKTTQEKLDVLTHMILAHHGEYEFGSPKLPMTAEAYVLHALDDLDAKMECLKNAYSSTEEGSFTNRIPWMENMNFYKPLPTDKKKED